MIVKAAHIESEGSREILRDALLSRQAVDLEALVNSTGMDAGTVRKELRSLVAAGEVEELRPVAFMEKQRRATVSTHYRLLRETDTKYLWEQSLVVRIPAARAFNFRQQESGERGIIPVQEQHNEKGRKTKMKKTRQAILGIVCAAACTGSIALAEETLTLDGSTTVGPIAKAFAEYYMSLNKDVNVTVGESGSGNGAKSLVNSTCDVANLSRFMKTSEFEAAVKNGVTPVAHVVAMDGLPVLVHPSNPVTDLKVSQVRDIFSGKITNWKQVGGPDRDIITISRETNSGTYETFYKLVMTHKVNDEKVKEKIAEKTEYVGSNGAIRARIQKTPNAIGYAGLGFVDRTVKALEIEGVYPDLDTVTSGEYAISRPLFMFTNGYPKLGSHVHRFVTLHLGPKGQEIVESIGFVPVTKY